MAITKPEQTFLEKLMNRIREIYTEEAKIISERHKKEMADELDKKMDEVVVRAGLRIKEVVSIETLGSEIKITIIKDK